MKTFLTYEALVQYGYFELGLVYIIFLAIIKTVTFFSNYSRFSDVRTKPYTPLNSSVKGVLMTNIEKFDKYLKEKNYRGAFPWLMDKINWNPDVIYLRGMCSYLMYVNGYIDLGTEIARNVLRVDPGNEWALAVRLRSTSLEFIENSYLKADDGKPFKLGLDWLIRFGWAEDEECKSKLVYCLANYGNIEQKRWLSENWLTSASNAPENEQPFEMNRQLTLPLDEAVKSPKSKG